MINVLISGGSIAGATLAYWLRRHGFAPTVVERAPQLRAGLGGQAVDLFGPAVTIADRMNVLPQVRAERTRIETVTIHRPRKRTLELSASSLASAVADRHVEILRGTLARILYEAGESDVEYVFGDSVQSLSEHEGGVDVTFEQGPDRRFDLVIGADGLHSNVRRLAFGDESRFLHYIGAHLAVFSMPEEFGLGGQMAMYTVPGKLVGLYPVRQTGEARAFFAFRRPEPLRFHHRDVGLQRTLLREAFDGEGWRLPRVFEHLDSATDFYFDTISQVRLDSWARGRVALVGDAGYSGGPAVSGGSTVAMVGAYLLAEELAAADGDPARAYPAYQDRMREMVLRSRRLAFSTLRTLIPASMARVNLTAWSLSLLAGLPGWLQRRLVGLQGEAAGAFDAVRLDREGART